MDLPAEVDRLRLDVLAVAISAELTAAGVPHALLKGPSTANWLYDPPRPYRDVDLLVPHSRVGAATEALVGAGLAESRGGRVGEEASHSLLLHSRAGFEIDLHISLPAVPADGDRIWAALEPHVEPLALDVGTVPALDQTGRCLVLALHALGGDPGFRQPVEDLRRALAVCGPGVWRAVTALAVELGVDDLVVAGIARAEGTTVPLSSRARLLVATGVPDAAFGLQRLSDARRRDRPRLLWRELVPSRGFMSHANGDADLAGAALAAAHLQRWRRIAAQLPAAVRARRDVR